MKQNVFRAETRCCTWNLVVVLGSMLFLLNNVSSWPAVAASGVLPATELANIIVHVHGIRVAIRLCATRLQPG
jgi:hypothetical protein